MKKYLVEFIGTFFFVLVTVTAVNGGVGLLAPIAIGSILMVMTYAGESISGAHYNPAVTLAIWLRGKCTSAEVPAYMIAQFAGASIAAVTGTFLLGEQAPPDAPAAFEGFGMGRALISELLGTFALCYVVLNTATYNRGQSNSYYGLAIGFTVIACTYAFSGFSGAAFNPANALGMCVAKMSSWSNIWIYLVANFSAATLATFIFKFVSDVDD